MWLSKHGALDGLGDTATDVRNRRANAERKRAHTSHTRTVRDHAIALHLSETQTTLSASALHGLPREVRNGPSRARVDLVRHHVL